MPGTHTNPQRIRALEQVSMVRTRQIQLSLHHITAAIDRHPRNDPRFALDIPTSFTLITPGAEVPNFGPPPQLYDRG